jgi:hypothetical protein
MVSGWCLDSVCIGWHLRRATEFAWAASAAAGRGVGAVGQRGHLFTGTPISARGYPHNVQPIIQRDSSRLTLHANPNAT